MSKNQAGMTLVELLVSFAILSILLITILTFFSQYINGASAVDDRLTAINLAEKELAIYKDTPCYNNHNRKINGKEYQIEITEFHAGSNEHQNRESSLGLSAVKVTVSMDDKVLTELYGYKEMDMEGISCAD
jgi:prepilin-type N-terminal cleavage/methylation domain-containing protein